MIRKPLLCRINIHKWGSSDQDTKVLLPVRWATRCKKCNTLLCYSMEPFKFWPWS